MALSIIPSRVSARPVGLAFWMDRVLERAGRIEPRWRKGNIHALRVALRRSSTMAEALREVNPASEWRKIKKTTRGLLHALGKLRDTQVARAWMCKLTPPGDPVRAHLLRKLSQREKKQRRLASQALKDFDRESWRKWNRRLEPKARFFPLESVVFQRIALARLADAFNLYQQARRRRSSIAWHRTRIAIKRFRYVLENFLPQRYELWAKDVKRFQNLLGEVHDLDVLRITVRRETARLDSTAVARLLARIEHERTVRLGAFRQESAMPGSPWNAWRAGFHSVRVLPASLTLPDVRRTA